MLLSGRDHRGLDGDRPAGGERQSTPQGPQRSGGRQGRNFLVSRGMAAQPTGEESSGTPLRPADRGAAGLRLDQPSNRGHGVRLRRPPEIRCRHDRSIKVGPCCLERNCLYPLKGSAKSAGRFHSQSDIMPIIRACLWARSHRVAWPRPSTCTLHRSSLDDPSFTTDGPTVSPVRRGTAAPPPVSHQTEYQPDIIV